MKLASTLLMLVAMIIAIPALANDLKVANDDSSILLDRVDCATDGCDFYGETVNANFDADGPFTFGPVGGGAGMITSVVLSATIDQTWMGDIWLWLYYDADGDGTYDVGPVAGLCRAGLDGCEFTGCCGCSGDLGGTYTFGDDGDAPAGEFDCPSFIPPGCYQSPPDSPATFAAFAGQPAGGDWYIEMGDGAAGDATTLIDWGVYVCTDETATDESSFSNVKSIY